MLSNPHQKLFNNEAKFVVSMETKDLVIYDPGSLSHRKDEPHHWLNSHKPIAEVDNKMIAIVSLYDEGLYPLHVAVGFDTVKDILPFYYDFFEAFKNVAMICDSFVVTSNQIFIGDSTFIPSEGWLPTPEALLNWKEEYQLPNDIGQLLAIENGSYQIHLFQKKYYEEDEKAFIKAEKWDDESIQYYFKNRENFSEILLVLEKIR